MVTADPGRSGGEGTGLTGWHAHNEVARSQRLYRDAWCVSPSGRVSHMDAYPVLVLDLAGAREQIARAIYQAEDDFDELIEAGMMRSHRREDFLAGAVLAALASQERGE